MPVTTFAPLAGGGINQQPITSFNYRTVGVNIDITPRLHHDDQVTLALKVSLSTQSGTGFGGLPTFGNREITTTIRLRMVRPTCSPGLIRDEERTSLAGVPGLSDLPLAGSSVRVQPQGCGADRHHPDADAARGADPGFERGRSAAVPSRARPGIAHSASRPPTATAPRPRRRRGSAGRNASPPCRARASQLPPHPRSLSRSKASCPARRFRCSRRRSRAGGSVLRPRSRVLLVRSYRDHRIDT